MKKGKFIVIDGTDGSGKKTQTELLLKRLKKEGIKAKSIDFPRYYNNLFGELIGECLAGEHGDYAKFDPKIASVLYAADRFESKEQIEDWLRKGNIVIADRYVSSNQIHQGGKITDARKRREFLLWLEKMEYEIFKIPIPDLIIYLSMPLKHTMKLLKNKDANEKKAYLNGKKDAHESDPKHLQNAKKSAMNLVKKENEWVNLNCIKDEELMGKEEISDLIWEKLKGNNIL